MNKPTRRPYATLCLIAVCIALGFVAVLVPGVVEKFGFSVQSPNPLVALTCLFIHANAIHLLGNMVFLAAVGASVEIASGTLRFLLVSLSSGLLGVLTFWLAARGNPEAAPLVGASGSIAGCAAYYSLRYTKLRVPLAPQKSATVAMVTIAWLVLQLIGAVVSIGQPVQGTSFFAHLGGAAMGILLGIFYKAPDLGDRDLGHQVLERLNDRGPHAAIDHAKQHLLEHPQDAEMAMNLAELYEEVGEFENESKTYLAHLFSLPTQHQMKAVERLTVHRQLSAIPAPKRRQLADKLRGEHGVSLLNSVIADEAAESQRPDAILELATLLQEVRPAESVALLRRLGSEYANHPVTELAKKRGLLK